jgi:hypothetical protein
VTKSAIVSVIASVLCGIFSVPPLLFGGWLVLLWIVTKLYSCVYLDYPYLLVGTAFMTLGTLALLCAKYGAFRRRFWRLLLIFPVFAGLWTLVVVPNIVPYDSWTLSYVFDVRRELEALEQGGRFPDDGSRLIAAAQRLRSPYYRDGRQLPYRVVTIANSSGPFLTSPGNDPGVIYYAVSPDHQQAWLTATELRFPNSIGGHVQFVPFLSSDDDPRVLRMRTQQASAFH